jgi:hypothetical protein
MAGGWSPCSVRYSTTQQELRSPLLWWIGDHICYYSDLRKMRAHYPGRDITVSLEETVRQIVGAWRSRLA